MKIKMKLELKKIKNEIKIKNNLDYDLKYITYNIY